MKTRPLFFNKALQIMVLTNAVVVVASAMLGPIYAFYVEEIGGDLLDAGFTAGIYALVAGSVTLVAGKYTDGLREKELVLVGGYLLTGVGFALFTVVDSMLSLFLVQALVGFADAFLSPSFDAIYSTHLDDGKEGMQWSMYGAATYFSTAIGMAVGAVVASQFGFDVLFWTMAILSWISGIYIYLLPRQVL